jgi:tRNA (guanine10-N2)-methyltransferase
VGTGSILVGCARFGAFCVGTDIDVRILRWGAGYNLPVLILRLRYGVHLVKSFVCVIRGKGGKNVFSNFQQYGLPLPELIRSGKERCGRCLVLWPHKDLMPWMVDADNSLYGRHFRTDGPVYDAILCDPPYGIR